MECSANYYDTEADKSAEVAGSYSWIDQLTACPIEIIPEIFIFKTLHKAKTT